MKHIHFTYQTPFSVLKDRTRLKDFIITICKKEKRKPGQITFVFCSDAYLLDINQRFLNHDTYTDIISFDYTEPGGPINGEIYISTQRVSENAQHLRVKLTEEIHRVIFHGVLHLCGYKDKLKEDKLLMRAKEDFYLRTYFAH
jgi:probable rRNA maturation factor